MQAKSAPSGSASHTVSRASGRRQRLEDHDDAEHDRERDEIRADDRERHELAGEADLADEIRVLQEAPRGSLRRGREEDPGGQATQQEEPVVVAADLGDAPENGEDEQVHEHEDERVEERPAEPEDRAAVFARDVAAEEASEELAMTNYVGVNGHRGESRATGRSTTLSRL